MRILITDRNSFLQQKLADRLLLAQQLRCSEHDEIVEGVSITMRENGWFDSVWITCCSMLERAAVQTVGSRC